MAQVSNSALLPILAYMRWSVVDEMPHSSTGHKPHRRMGHLLLLIPRADLRELTSLGSRGGVVACGAHNARLAQKLGGADLAALHAGLRRLIEILDGGP